MFSYRMVHKRDPSQQTIRSSKRCKRRSIETVQTEWNAIDAIGNKIEQRNAWRGSATTRHAQVAEWGGGEEFEKWKAENPRLQMKQIPLQHDMFM